ncbi:MAG: O-antigen ligase family protein [Candidatus Aminicenantes bacterium]|nr:O-antigen ligase family protein [Candidatus Aminicenantes bacterium]
MTIMTAEVKNGGGPGLFLWLFLCGTLLFALVSISAAQIFLAAALAAWLLLLAVKKERPAFPAFFWLLLAYAGLSLVSAAFSIDPATSFKDCRELLLFLAVPLVFAAFLSLPRTKAGAACLLASAMASCGYSLFHFVLRSSPGERATGFMGHTMTQGGLLMLFSLLALALFLFLKEKLRWLWAAALIPSLACLVLTQTRSAWLGFLVGATALLGIYKPKLLVLPPLLVGLFFLLSQPLHKRFSLVSELRERALSVFSLKDKSNRDRLEYLRAGWKVITLRPLLGTGPDTVDEVFTDPSLALSGRAAQNVHLHNNLVQIAAERGLPAAAVWIAFLAWAAVSALRVFRRDEPWPKALAGTALAAVISLFVAGMFEYNFGDSEITVLFLILITLPLGLDAATRRAATAGTEIP